MAYRQQDDHFLEKHKRINPDTGKPFKRYDPRPQKDAVISPTSGKRVVQLESTFVVGTDGVKQTVTKSYSCDDGKMFEAYKKTFNARGKKRKFDTHGKYYEIWRDPINKVCSWCGKDFIALRNGIKNCEDCRITNREGTDEEWEARGWVECRSRPEIKARTGCTGKRKPEEFRFDNRKIAKSKYRARCHECENERSWVNNLEKKFGITPEEYDTQLAWQGGGCEICGNDQISKLGKKLYVDHDHEFDDDKDKQFNRGIICLRCNDLLGFRGLKEDIEYAEKILSYLIRGKLTKELMAENPKLYKEPFPMIDEPDEPTD